MLHHNILSDNEQNTALQLINAIEENSQDDKSTVQLLGSVISAMQELINPSYDSFNNRLITEEAIRNKLQNSQHNLSKDQFENMVKLAIFYVGKDAIGKPPRKNEMKYAPRQMFIRQKIFEKFRPAEFKLLDTIPANKNNSKNTKNRKKNKVAIVTNSQYNSKKKDIHHIADTSLTLILQFSGLKTMLIAFHVSRRFLKQAKATNQLKKLLTDHCYVLGKNFVSSKFAGSAQIKHEKLTSKNCQELSDLGNDETVLTYSHLYGALEAASGKRKGDMFDEELSPAVIVCVPKTRSTKQLPWQHQSYAINSGYSSNFSESYRTISVEQANINKNELLPVGVIATSGDYFLQYRFHGLLSYHAGQQELIDEQSINKPEKSCTIM